MAEPREFKGMEEPPHKKTKYLRLGHQPNCEEGLTAKKKPIDLSEKPKTKNKRSDNSL